VRRRGHVGGLFGSPDSLAQVVTNDAFRIALLQLLQWTAVKLGLHAVYAVISQRVGKRYPWLERFLQWLPTVVATFLMTTASTNPKMIQMKSLVGAIAATFLRYVDNYLQTRQDQSAPDSVSSDTKDPMEAASSQSVAPVPASTATPAPPMLPEISEEDLVSRKSLSTKHRHHTREYKKVTKPKAVKGEEGQKRTNRYWAERRVREKAARQKQHAADQD